MFGIGFPEMLLILALALIVVGPDKLPDLARSVAKGIFELKKTAEGLKDSMDKDGDPLGETRKELEDAATALRKNLLDTPDFNINSDNKLQDMAGTSEAQSAYRELMKNQAESKFDTSGFIDIDTDETPVEAGQEQAAHRQTQGDN